MTQEKRKVGRPSKYNEDLQAQADEYIYRFAEFGDVVPTLAGLACFLGISRETCNEWPKIYPQFSDTTKAVSVMQERALINGGLSKANDSGITKLLLASNHGYSDRIEQAHTSPDGSFAPTRIEIVAPSDNSKA